MCINFFLNYDNTEWQRPNNTEEEVFLRLCDVETKDKFGFNYIAYPWANYIDIYNEKKGKKNISSIQNCINYNCTVTFPKNNLNITCFQSYHIWNFIDDFKKMNINIVFSPHCEIDKSNKIFLEHKILVLPIFLIPMIVPDFKYLDFNIPYNKDMLNPNFDLDYFKKHNKIEFGLKKYDFSFVGSCKYNNENLSNFRLKCLNIIKDKDKSYVFDTKKWHLNELIYEKKTSNTTIINKHMKELNYFQNMIYSKYILCTKGIGPNSFRISETIKFKNIPIIIADKLMLPKINDMSYDKYSIVIKENELDTLINLDINNYNTDILYKNIDLADNYLNNLANPIIDFFDERFNLLITWWEMGQTTLRFKEYLHVLNLNLKNNDIKKIYLFFEYLDNFNLDEILNKFDFLKNDKIIIIPKKKKDRRYISFNEVIEFANKNLFGEKIIISNNDIYFENLNKVKKDKLLLKNMILALTRTNIFDSYSNGKVWRKHTNSQDSWMYVSPIKIPNDIIYIGWLGCDNRLPYELLNMGYNLSNPTDIIKCYHYQSGDTRNDYISNRTHQGDGGVMDVPFTELDQICEDYKQVSYQFTESMVLFKWNMFKLLLLFTNNTVINKLDYDNILKFDKYQELMDYFNNSNETIIILSDTDLNHGNCHIIQKNHDLLTIKRDIIKKYKDTYLNYLNPYYKKPLSKLF